MIWFLNTFPIFRYTLPVLFICGVWLRWINMSTACFKIKTRRGWFIWVYLWREPTVFRIVLMAFSFYLIEFMSGAAYCVFTPPPVLCPILDPCQIITPLVLVGLGLGVGEGLGLGVGLGLGNHIAISTRGVIIWQGSKMGTTPARASKFALAALPATL